jgi:Trk K+ transport system NAD-binding subunit
MTGSYDLLLPLLITSFAAYTVAEFMKSEPIYESLLQRLAANQNFELPESERVFVEAEIRLGSDLIEKKLKESPLPEGILVVLCSYRGKEFVPNGNTILLESMKISVLAQSLDSLQTLQELTNGWEGSEA